MIVQRLKILLFVLVMLLHNNLGAHDYKRMTILFDKDSEGPALNQQAALITTLAINLHQQAAPALVSFSVANGFLERKYNTALQQNDWNKQLFALIAFDLAQWRIFHCKNSQFFLFAPVSMPWVTTPETISVDGVSIAIPAIKMSALDQFQGSDIQALRAWVAAKQNASQEIAISQLESLFFNDNDIKKDPTFLSTIKQSDNLDEKVALVSSLTKPWNMFIQGHGSYGEKISATSAYLDSIAGLSPAKFQELLLLLNRMNTNVVALSSCYSGGKNLDYIQFKDNLNRKKFAQNLKYIFAVISSSDSPSTTSSYVSTFTQTIGGKSTTTKSISFTGGLNIKDFYDGLEKMAGANWLADSLRNLARGAEFESSENVPQILIPNGGWFQAFTHQKQLTLSSAAKTKELKAIEEKLKRKNLTEIQKDVLERRKKFLMQSGSPQVPSISPIQIIGDVLIKKHEIEKAPLSIKQKNVVLIYPTIIPVPLVITPTASGFPTMLSMQRGDAGHVFDSISLTASGSIGVQAFLRQGFLTLKDRRAKKTFLIKTLSGVNDFSEFIDQNKTKISISDSPITLNQVLVNSWTNAQNNMTLNLYFMLKESYWKFTFYGRITGDGWTFPCTQIKKEEFDAAFTTLNSAIVKLDQQLSMYQQEKPSWKIGKPQQAKIPSPEGLAEKLLTVKQKLSDLKGNLENLKNGLMGLKAKFKPAAFRPLPFKPVPAA